MFPTAGCIGRYTDRSSEGDSTTFMGRFISVLCVPDHCPSPCHWVPPKRAWPHPFSTLLLRTYKHWWDFLSFSFSPHQTTPGLSVFPPTEDAPGPSLSLWLSTGLSPVLRCLPWAEEPRTGLKMWPFQSRMVREDHLPWPLATTLSLMHPGTPLAFLATSEHCWLMASLLSASIPRSFSIELLSSRSAYDPYRWMQFFHSK